MAEVKWIKIVTDIFDDEKILFIEQLPEADSIIVIWFKLLTLAGKINNGGVLLFNDKLPYTDEMLATIFRRPINTVRLAIKTFIEFEMVEVINDTLTIPNWSKHQTLDQLEERKNYMKNYMKEYREKQKLIATGNVNSKVNSVPNSKANVNSLDIDIDKELDIEEDKENNIIILNSDEAQFFKILEGIENYPLDRQKDLDMYNRLKERYPTLNLIESLKDWATYKLDKPLKAKDNPRSQINTSFKKYVEWGKNLKGGNTSGKHESTNGKSAETPKYDTSKWLYKGGK